MPKRLFWRDPLSEPEALMKRVYAYVAYRIGDGPDAEDVTSAVLENALRYRDTYDPARGTPLRWLLGIARRCVAEAAVGRRQPPAELCDEADWRELEHETIERLTLQAALQTLDERDRELIALRYGADLRAREVGHVLGLKTNAVDVALHRARARFRRALEAEEATGPPDTRSRPGRAGVRIPRPGAY